MNKGAAAPHPLAFLALLAGAAAIAFAPIFVRLSDVSPLASAFWRMALALPMLWLWAWATRERSNPSTPSSPTQSAAARRAPLKAALIAGVCFACDLGAWHVSLTWTSVANATLEANFAPVFVTLGAWLLWKQRPNLKFLAALATTLTGAVLIIAPNAAVSRVALAGDMLGVLSAVFYAGYMLAIKRATGQMAVARLMAISATMTAATLLPLALLTSERFVPAGLQGWVVLAGLALIAQVAGQSLIGFALSHLPAALSSTGLILQSVLAALFAWVLLHEAMTPLQMAGGVIVLIGIYGARRAG
jgi:drug/metabolite transporter (DMT)-like permease